MHEARDKPELARRVAEWRRTVERRMDEGSSIDELENHLVESVEAALAEGVGLDTAWDSATQRLGEPHALAAEFSKLGSPRRFDRQVLRALALLGATAALALAYAGYAGAQRNASNAWLASHVISMSFGYAIALTVAAAGLYLALRSVMSASRASAGLHPKDARDLARALGLGCLLVTSCSLLGIVLGSIWAGNELGRAWSFDPREIGAVLVLAYYAGFGWLLFRRQGRTESLAALASLGGALTLLAWFGAGMLVQSSPPAVASVLFLSGSVVTCTLLALSSWRSQLRAALTRGA